jgi:nitrate reductase NapAB chaperone NapD
MAKKSRAYVVMNTTTGQEESVRKALLKIKGVVKADTVTGRYSNIAVMQGNDMDEVLGKILGEVRNLPGVLKTCSLFAKQEKKETETEEVETEAKVEKQEEEQKEISQIKEDTKKKANKSTGKK